MNIKIERYDASASYILAPYTIKTVKTTINGETVWHSNKFKNLFLKIKYFLLNLNI